VTVNTSNSTFLTVLPSTALDGVGWTCRVLSERDYVTPIALVERFAGMGFTMDANAEGGGTVALDSDDGIFSGALPAGETTRLADQEALWQILEDGQVRFEFLAEDVDEDIIPDGGGPRQTVVAGRGTASVLEWAPVLPEGMPTPTSMTREFNAHPMTAWFQLFQEAQAEDFLSWVTLSFDGTTDSHGNPWGGPQTLTVNAGDTLLDLLKRWAEANELSWRMRPGFTLEVHQDGGSRLEDTVVFTQYRSQGEHKRKITRRELANIVYADSGDNGLAFAEDSTSAGKWRKRAAWISAGDASDASARSAVANITLSLAKDQRLSRTLKLLPDREGRQPFVDFSVQDWVGVEVPDDDAESGARQVVGLAVDIDADGVVQYEATLQSRFEVRAIKTQRLLDKLGASERSGSGSAAASPIPVSKAMSVVKMADLADVDLTAPSTGSLLQWNGARWVDVVGNLDFLADVDTSGTEAPTAGQVLTYDAGAGLWKPATAAAGVSTLDGLSDVTAPAPTNGQVLTYETATSQWKPAAAAGGGATLPDVLWKLTPQDGTAAASFSGNPWNGTAFTAAVACTLKKVHAKFNAVSGISYDARLLVMGGDTRVVSSVVDTATIVAPSSGVQMLEWPGLSWTLTAGVRYGLIFRRADGTNADWRYINIQTAPSCAYAYTWGQAIDCLTMPTATVTAGTNLQTLSTFFPIDLTLGM
jgi:hypothetical protein